MAKLSLAERLKAIDKISDGINKSTGTELAGRIGASKVLQAKLEQRFIPSPSMNVNAATGGGFPVGGITIVSGEADSGKTGILLETIARRMKEDPDFVAIWLESEGSVKIQHLMMFGIDLNRIIYISHDREGAGEEAINRIEAFLIAGVCDFIVINSLKALVPSEEFKKGMESLQVGAQSRMNAKMIRKLTAIVEENEVALVIVQHLTTQIGEQLCA